MIHHVVTFITLSFRLIFTPRFVGGLIQPMTSTKKIMKHRKGRIGSLLFVVTVLGLLCTLFLARFDPESTLKTSQSLIASTTKLSSASPSFAIVEDDVSNHPSHTTLRNEIHNNKSHARSSLRTPPSSGKPANLSFSRETAQRRKLPGGYADYGDPAMAGGAIIFVLLLVFLLCCCRGMLCDILACVCLYEICCGDGAVGGFDLMPF
jgi:hypothetical protein